MAITANLLPQSPPDFTLPVDSSLQFASAQTLSGTGYINNANAQLTVNPGRFDGVLAVDITANSVTEDVQIGLLGSNDVNWGNGNVVLLTMFDIPAVAADALIPTICGVYPTIPPAGKAGWVRAQPFTNYIGGGYVMQYLKLYCTFVGTGAITLSAWVVPARIS
jgi:hypothetical protein